MNPTLKFIGHIRTPYKAMEDCPNNVDPNGPRCEIVVDEAYKDGLLGLDTGQEILVLYWFENADRDLVRQGSGNGKGVKGTFALRSPHRPNPIAAAVLPIDEINNGSVFVRGLDCLDGTRLLDIKPAIKREMSHCEVFS